MRRQSPDAGISATDSIDVTFGQFHLSGFRLPYMTAMVSLDQAAMYLNLVKDDPTYARQDWTIEQLYQREVDHSRVRDIADNYLTEESPRPQFFNALTVVLRPKSRKSYNSPSPTGQYANPLQVGPICIEFDQAAEGRSYPKSGTFGMVRWNIDEVWATAIDGQHRLAAIRDLRGRNRERLQTSHIAVILVVIDEQLGFRAPGDWDVLKTMRSLFIDLNKRAIPVTRARNLLLDDLDPTAEFVRQLMGPGLRFEPTGDDTPDGFPVGTGGEFVWRLPLELVDWHGESKSKVERGPYVTSVLALDWIVRRLLSEKKLEIKERFDLDDVEDDGQYEKIREALSKWPRAWNTGIREAWEEARDTKTFFYLTHQHVEFLGREFSLKWGRPLTRLLTRPIPYRRVAEKRLSTDTLTPEFGQWYQAKAAKDLNERTRFAEHFRDELHKIREELKRQEVNIAAFEILVERIEQDLKNNSILFYLVGQRALIQGFLDLQASEEAAEWSEWAEIGLEEFEDCMNDFYAFYLVTAFNAIYGAGDKLKRQLFVRGATTERRGDTEDLAREFWAGSLVKRDAPDQMDFSQSAAIRGSKWFGLLAHLYWFCRTNDVSRSDVMHFWDKLLLSREPSGIGELYFGEVLKEAIVGIRGKKLEGSSVYRHPMAFLVYGLEEEGRTMDKLNAASRQRLDHALDLCLEAAQEAQ